MSGPYGGEQPGYPPRPDHTWQPPAQPFGQPPVQQFGQPFPQWAGSPPAGPPPQFQRYAGGSFGSVQGLGTAISILVWFVVLGQALFAASDWYTYAVVKDHVEGSVQDPGRLDRADIIASATAGGYLLALLAAAVVFVVWLWRVRSNAELFCAGRHRLGRGWVIGGWICPIVNLWFPKQIVDDVIAASDPRTPPLVQELRGIRRNGLVLAWWLTWIAGVVIGSFGGTDYASDVPDVSDQAIFATLSTISAALTAVAALLAVRVVRLINRLQTSRPWTPWWTTTPWAAPATHYPYGATPPWPMH